MLGVDLSDVHDVLVTHAHPDHLAPATLLWRAWATGGARVTVHGPQPVVDEIQRWFADDATVRTQTLRAGDDVEIAGLRVRAIAGSHEVETLLYDVTGPEQESLLYATDTGPLPPGSLAACAGRAYDLALIEQTFGRHTEHATMHLDLVTFGRHAGRTARQRRPDRPFPGARGAPEPPQPARGRAARTSWPGGAPNPASTACGSRSAPRRPRPTPHLPTPRSGCWCSAGLGRARARWRSPCWPTCPTSSTSPPVGTGPTTPTGAPASGPTSPGDRPAGPPRPAPTLSGLLRADGPALLIDCLTLWLTAVMDDGWGLGRAGLARLGPLARHRPGRRAGRSLAHHEPGGSSP